MKVSALTGADLRRSLADVALLRIEVFRAWPYLYDGDLNYEEAYLTKFATSDRAIVVGAYDQDRLVGASTGAPLADHAEDFATAFSSSPMNIDDVFYCAESVLLPQYRGKGLGHLFFDEREQHAAHHGFRHVVFCSVVRPEDHPDRPTNYRPLDAFWRRRGYETLEGVMAEFSWKDCGQQEKTSKPLQFWHRTLP